MVPRETKKRSSLVPRVVLTIVSIIFALLCVSLPSRAVEQLNTLGQLAAAISEAANSISLLADAFTKLTSLSTRGFDPEVARRTHTRLIELSTRAVDLSTDQQVFIINPIDKYLWEPSAENWITVTGRLEVILIELNTLLTDVKVERSDFVVEPAYFDLLKTLKRRGLLIRELIDMPPPQSQAELKQLRDIKNNYAQLLMNFKRAIQGLNAYIKMTEASK